MATHQIKETMMMTSWFHSHKDLGYASIAMIATAMIAIAIAIAIAK